MFNLLHDPRHRRNHCVALMMVCCLLFITRCIWEYLIQDYKNNVAMDYKIFMGENDGG